MFEIYNISELPAVAQQILAYTKTMPRVWLFEGEMGAGKTTLIKALGEAMGVQDTIQSPTYSLVNEYALPQAGKIYHFDLYRLQHETEALDFGIEEYLDSGHYCWVEWAERIPNLLPLAYLTISITVEADKRILNFQLKP